MSDDPMPLNLEKRRIVQHSLEKRFQDVKIGGDFLPLFVLHNGRDSWQLQFTREFLDDFGAMRELQLYIESTVIPAILVNPAKRLQIDADGGITITEKWSDFPYIDRHPGSR